MAKTAISIVKKEPQREKPFRGELYTVKEAAKHCRMGLSSMYKCIKRGYIVPFELPLGPTLIDSADLDDYIFFSRLKRDDRLIINKIDKEKIIARFEEQILHTRAYVEKILKEACKEV